MGLMTNVQAATNSVGNAVSGSATAQHPNPLLNTLMMVAIFGLFIYFLLWRPQSKRLRDHRNLMSAIKEGDEIITSGGVLGKVDKVGDSIIDLIVSEGTKIKIQKSAVVGTLPKGSLK